MLWPRPSTVSTKPRSSFGAGRGGRSTPSSSRPWNGSIGSTIAGCWSPSATSRRPRPRSTTTPRWTNQLWRRDSNETASGKPGAFSSTLHVAHVLVWFEYHSTEHFFAATGRSQHAFLGRQQVIGTKKSNGAQP